jgi:serine/threonine-protein kinase
MEQHLIDTAAEALGVTGLDRLREAGQKLVARAVAAGTDVMFKVIGLDTATNPAEVLERATREAALLADIDHPNLVHMASDLSLIGDPPRAVAWLEEYLDGEDLRDRLGIPWAWSDTLELGLQVARGLEVLHERDVVHRDLSPSNVRCVTDGRYVIIDPGYARHLARSTITVFGQPGTPGYLSPEHLSQDGPVPASDIFCVGILMYRALTGDLPIPLAGGIEIYQRALRNGRAPSVALARPDLLPTSVAVVDRCLQTQPARRYLDGAELVEGLEAL